MLNIQEYRSSMECMTSNIEELRILFDIASLLIKIQENEEKMNHQDFWNDNELAQKCYKKTKV